MDITISCKTWIYFCGIDISEDLLKISRAKMDSEKFRVYAEVPLDNEFLIHDMESKSIDKDSFVMRYFSQHFIIL